MKDIKYVLTSFGIILLIALIDFILERSIDLKSDSFAYLCLGGFIYLYVKHSKHFD